MTYEILSGRESPIPDGDDSAGSDKVRSLIRLIQKDDAVAALIKSCNEVGEAFLFGGMIRDAVFGSSSAFGDLDIFVSGPLDIGFAESLSRTSRRTNFGGMRLVVGRFEVDIWELPKSHAFRIEKGRSVSIPSLLETVCFSTDAVAASLQDARIISTTKFKESFKNRSLSFVSRPIGLEILQVVRIARLMVKIGVKPDVEIANYYIRGYKLFDPGQLVAAEQKWRGRRVLDRYLVDHILSVCQEVSAPALGPGGDDELRTLFD